MIVQDCADAFGYGFVPTAALIERAINAPALHGVSIAHFMTALAFDDAPR
jgi:hypothetical protein